MDNLSSIDHFILMFFLVFIGPMAVTLFLADVSKLIYNDYKYWEERYFRKLHKGKENILEIEIDHSIAEKVEKACSSLGFTVNDAVKELVNRFVERKEFPIPFAPEDRFEMLDQSQKKKCNLCFEVDQKELNEATHICDTLEISLESVIKIFMVALIHQKEIPDTVEVKRI